MQRRQIVPLVSHSNIEFVKHYTDTLFSGDYSVHLLMTCHSVQGQHFLSNFLVRLCEGTTERLVHFQDSQSLLHVIQ